MKIISKFRDYYDPVAMTWGGGDPKIRYERLEIKNTGPFEFREIEPPFHIRYIKDMHDRYDQRILIVGQRIYGVFWPIPVNGQPQYFLPDETHEIMTSKYPSHIEAKRPLSLYRESPHVIELCRLVGQPVFWIRQFHKEPHLTKRAFKQKHLIEISRDPPKLYEIANFAKSYPADQIYQDLSYVLGNLMHNPPDDNPPVQVDEKVRWAKKGFDAKTSFRGKKARDSGPVF